MTCCDWIICERAPRWTPAIRLAIECDSSITSTGVRLREVRRLGELTAELAQRSGNLVAVEIDAANFAAVLSWLATVERQFATARCVALLDSSFSSSRIKELSAALYEAGAVAIATSPRQIAGILEVARQHAESMPISGSATEDASLAALVWGSLPWQDG